MKKSLILFLTLFILSFPIFSIAQTYSCSFDMGSSGTGTGIVTDTNCNQAQYYPVIGPLCKDSNTNLIYTGTGTGVVLVGGGTGCTGNLCAITASANGLSLIEAANYAAIKTLLSYYTSSDVGVTIEGYDSTILKSASIGSTVQAHNSTLDALAAVSLSTGYLYWNGSAWAFQTPSGGGTILGSLAATQYAIPMANGTANTLTLSQWLTDSSGDLLLPTGAVIKINNVTVLGSGSNGSYYLGLGNNTLYTPVSGQYRFLFLNGVPEVDVNGTASAICLAGGTCSGYQASGSYAPASGSSNYMNVPVTPPLANSLWLYDTTDALWESIIFDSTLTYNHSTHTLSVSGGGGCSGSYCSATAGTGVIMALGANVGSNGSIVVNGGALGTPSSGNASNLTNFPTLNQSTSGTAGGLSGTPNIAVNNFTVSGIANVTGSTWTGSGVANTPSINIAHGSFNVPTNAIGANACVNVDVTDANIAANDIADWTFGDFYTDFDPPGLYARSRAAISTTITFRICNPTGANITPGANETIRWTVRR